MIDTIVLMLPTTMFSVKDPDKFQPSARWIMNLGYKMGSRAYIVSKQNPTKTELENGTYKPRLTITNRFNSTGRSEPSLKIELSLPKLLFGNNFDELSDCDFEKTVLLLKQRLEDMGVVVDIVNLQNAPVSSVHYSKNIPLTDGSTPHYLINKIKEANVSLSLDVNQTDFRNEGYSYKWHANSYEVTFYDKIKDLETANNSVKRAVEKDSYLQLDLFNNLQQRRKLEVLRMEVRINSRQKMRHLFNKLSITKELAFNKLFSKTISQKILTYYLSEITNRRFSLFDCKVKNIKDLIASLIINNPRLGILRVLQLVGLKLTLDEIGIRELRAIFTKYHQRSWYRLVSIANEISIPRSSNPLSVISSNLASFVPLKLIDFSDRLINNDKYK